MFVVEHVEHCSLCSLSNTSNASNIARLTRYRTRRTHRTLFAQFAIEHVEHCSFAKSSNMQAIVLRATCCVVINIPRCFELKLVTLSFFSKIFVLKAKRSSSCFVNNKVAFVLHSKSNVTIH